MKKLVIIIAWISIFCHLSFGQQNLTGLSWQKVATGMPDSWYGSEESVRVAENVLLYQRDTGGWPKNTPFHKVLTETQKDSIRGAKKNPDSIFDNGATTTEIRFLARMFGKTGSDSYRIAAEKGIRFILKAQYSNGGWPMFFPLKKGYYTHITYNDDAFYRIMRLLKEIYNREDLFSFVADESLTNGSKEAWDRGNDCLIKTQIVVNGKPTVWCAQHDETTLQPAKARAYELPSFSGAESAGLLMLLMEVENPSPEIIKAVEGGIDWLKNHKLAHTRWDNFINAEGKKDRRIINDKDAGDLWARFYDLETGEPFVCDRDGVKKKSLEEIGYERRNGYSWYTDAPEKALKAYEKWKRNRLH